MQHILNLAFESIKVFNPKFASSLPAEDELFKDWLKMSVTAADKYVHKSQSWNKVKDLCHNLGWNDEEASDLQVKASPERDVWCIHLMYTSERDVW